MRRISMDQRNVGAQHAAPLQRMASPTAPPLHRVLGPRIFRAVTTQLTCPSCRAEIPSGSAFCPACGTPSPTVITNELAAAAVPAAGLAGVPTAQRLARALGSKYEVRRLVGRGGFAEVYELWDKDLDRRLACKVLHPEIAWTPGMLARFRQEAKALARLQHPSILPIHFTGDGEGLVYYVMPFVEGRSDLYAFGAMLYQLVTGTPPYDGASSAEIVGKHLADPVPVASDVNAKIPRWLSSVIVKCLAKKPEDRYQSADEVLAALAAGRASGATGLVGARTLERQVRRSGSVRSRTARLGWWAAAALALVVAGGVARRAGYLGSAAAFVHNGLVEPVEILRDGIPLDTVAPDATTRLWLQPGRVAGLGWRLLRPGSPPLGEPMEGALGPFTSVRGRRVARIAAALGSQSFFAPLITNSSASDITLEVNPGTAAAARCGCLVPRGAVRAHIGYYRLYRNSAVAAYNSAHPYTGPHVDRDGFAERVAPLGGAVVLEF